MATRHPDLDVAAEQTMAVAVRFASALRAANLRADLGAVIGFARSLTLIDLSAPGDVRSAGATFFVDRPEELLRYQSVFDRFWLREGGPRDLPEISQAGESDTPGQPRPQREPRDTSDAGTSDGTDRVERALAPVGDGEGPAVEDLATSSVLAYSASEAFRKKAFDKMTAVELRDASRLIDELRPRLARRSTRRYRIHRRGQLLAPRAMMRRSLGTGGDQLAWLWRRRRTRSRPIVVICDVSGSMEQHSRFALRLVHALTRTDVRTESFVFGTRLTRITPHLRRRDADDALHEVAESVNDWAGGTQIGRALHVFNRRWARRVLRSSAIVIIVSDGWDRGDPRLVTEAMGPLARRCHRVVWLNPLAATTGYEPRTGGMAAAYPFIDDFLPIGNVESLERLATALGRLRHVAPSRGPIAHELRSPRPRLTEAVGHPSAIKCRSAEPHGSARR